MLRKKELINVLKICFFCIVFLGLAGKQEVFAVDEIRPVREVVEESIQHEYEIMSETGITASGECGDNLTWELKNGTLTIRGTGDMWDFGFDPIPWETYRAHITKLVLPDGLTSVGDGAFYDCSSLSGELIIPNTVTEIGQYAFYGCKGFTGKLVLPEELETIGVFAFRRCAGLEGEVVIPQKVESIELMAFTLCDGIEIVTFLGDLPVIEDSTFGIVKVYYPADNLTWSNVSEISSEWGHVTLSGYYQGECGDNLTWELKDSILTIKGFGDMWDYESGTAPWYAYREEMTKLVLSEGLKSIGDRAFYRCSKFDGELKLPEGLIGIGDGAFSSCGRFSGELGLPEGVTSIGTSAFIYCSGFSGELRLPEGLASIGDFAFYDCTGFSGELILPKSLRDIGERAFEGCRGFTGNLTLPEGMISIGERAFMGCSGFSGDLNLPASMKSIAFRAFRGCSGFRGELKLPEELMSIQGEAFCGCSSFSGKLTLPEGLTSIGYRVFEGCSGFSGELSLPEGLTSIGYSAFSDCSGFTGELKLPEGLTTIGTYAFENCSGLNKIMFYGNQPNFSYSTSTSTGEVYRNQFSGITAKVYYPAQNSTWLSVVELEALGLGDKLTWVGYQSGECGDNLTWELIDGTLTIKGSGDMWDFEYDTRPWYEQSENITAIDLPEGLTRVGNHAFSYCTELTGELILPESLKSIGNASFAGCSSLEGNLVLPRGLERLEESAFKDCSSFNGDLLLPDNITYLGSYAFSGCSGFDGTLTLPQKLGSIAINTFAGCNNFSGELKLPDNLTNIECYAFYNCNNFTGTLELPEKVTSIGGYAFAYCSGFRGELLLPDNLTSIGQAAFLSCTGFSGSLLIPEGITRIEPITFQSCTGFDGRLQLPGGLQTIDSNAFLGCSGFSGTLELPEGLGRIGNNAFEDCSGFDGELKLPESLESIPRYAFSGCSGFYGKLELPESIKEIGAEAFYGCDQIDTLIFYGDQPAFGVVGAKESGNQFYGMTADAYYPWGNDTWADISEIENLNLGGNLTWMGWHTGQCGSNLTYTLMGESLTISGIGDMFDFSIANSPWHEQRKDITSLNIGENVTSIGNYAFYDCDSLMGELILPLGITKIGVGAFNGCSGFTEELNLPSNLSVIENASFRNCSGFTGELNIPRNVTKIEDNAFSGCSSFTGDLEIPDKVIFIGENAFLNCSELGVELRISENIETIEDNAFSGCNSFSNIIFDGNKPDFAEIIFEDVVVDAYYPDNTAAWNNVEQIGDLGGTLNWISYPKKLETFGKCGDNLTWELEDGVLTITGTGEMWDYGTDNGKEINSPWYSFKNDIQELVLEKGITRIGNHAFKNCESIVGKLSIPDTVTVIGSAAFYKCTGFTGDLIIPDTVMEIGINAFRECDGFNGSLILPKNMESIENSVFFGCKGFKGELILPQKVTVIGSTAFTNCVGLSGELLLPEGVTDIGDHAFSGCEGFQGNLYLPETVKTLGIMAFGNCKGFDGELKLSKSLTDVSDYAFTGCSNIKTLIIPKGMETIGKNSFYQCISLSGNIQIPEGMKAIGESSFAQCGGISSITFEGERPVFGNLVFEGVTASGFYDGDDASWEGIEDVTTLGGNITWGILARKQCGDELFFRIKNGILILDGKGDMWDFELEGSPWYSQKGDITGIVFPEGITGIGDYAFDGCSSLCGELNVPEQVTRIGKKSFYGCKGIEGSVYLPKNLVSVGEQAFYDCTGLKGTLEIPASLTETGNWAFGNCQGIDTIIFKGKKPVLGEYLFRGITANAYCPDDDASWEGIEDVTTLGGNITWIFDTVVLPQGFRVTGVRDLTYNGKKQTQNLVVYDGKKAFIEGKDYTLVYKNNLNAYTKGEGEEGFSNNNAPYVEIRMKGNYTGSKRIYFKIYPVDISQEVQLNADYLSAFVKPLGSYKINPVLIWNGRKLKMNKDFKVEGKTVLTNGIHSLNFVGQGNFTGTISGNHAVITEGITEDYKTLVIMNKVTVKGYNKSFTYTGKPIEPKGFTVEYKKRSLAMGEYTIEYRFNEAVGTAYIILTGTGTDVDGDGVLFHGTKTISFNIVGTAMNKKNITVSGLKDQIYTGSPICPEVTLRGKGVMEEGIHYNVTYKKNVGKGTAQAIFEGIESGGYTGSLKVNFKILPASVAGMKVTFLQGEAAGGSWQVLYTKGAVTPAVTVTTKEGEILKPGKDYTVKYKNNKQPGGALAVIVGKGNYGGSNLVSFQILKKELSNENGIRVVVQDKVATGKAGDWKQTVKVVDLNGKLLSDKDYDKKNIKYTLIERNGTVTEVPLTSTSVLVYGDVVRVTVKGLGIYGGTKAEAYGIYRVIRKGYDISKAVLQIKPQEYTGGEIELVSQNQIMAGKAFLNISKGNPRNLILGENIEVVEGSYIKNIEKGTAKVTFRGIGAFGGFKTVTFKILPMNITSCEWSIIYSDVF